MIVAGVSAHAKKGFFAHNGGYEYTLILGIAALSLAFTGAGPLSLDALLGDRLAGQGGGSPHSSSDWPGDSAARPPPVPRGTEGRLTR